MVPPYVPQSEPGNRSFSQASRNLSIQLCLITRCCQANAAERHTHTRHRLAYCKVVLISRPISGALCTERLKRPCRQACKTCRPAFAGIAMTMLLLHSNNILNKTVTSESPPPPKLTTQMTLFKGSQAAPARRHCLSHPLGRLKASCGPCEEASLETYYSLSFSCVLVKSLGM